MMPTPWGRAARGFRTALAALPTAAAFARAGAGPRAAAALFVAGLVHATPATWGGRLLRGFGIRRQSLRPRRLSGDRLVIDPADRGHTCVVEELFVPPVAYDLALVDFETAAVIDCGAHIGAFTLLARRRFPSAALVAFEPNPDNQLYLRENLRNNGVSAEIVAAAVSTRDGRADFRAQPGRSESGRLVELPGGAAVAGERSAVDVVDLPAFVTRLAPAALVVKMDIEGEEERLLPALVPVLPRTCAIFFETHRGDAGWEAVRRVLTAGSFAVRLVRQRDVFYDGFAIRH